MDLVQGAAAAYFAPMPDANLQRALKEAINLRRAGGRRNEIAHWAVFASCVLEVRPDAPVLANSFEEARA